MTLFLRTLLLSAIALVYSSTLLAKEEILWVKWTLTPEYIDKGPFQDTGYLDQFLDHVQSRLPEYSHRDEFQTPNRISRSWDLGNVCTVHLWLGYWPDKITYSKAYAFTPRFGIVTKNNSDFDKQFIGKESVSLKYLLEQTQFKLGMLPLYYAGTKDARYPLMAPLIAPHLNTEKVNEFRNNRNEMTVAYLDKGRVDYYIRQRITHFSELKIENKPNRYQFYFLDEGYRHKLTAAACSNTTLGKTVISKINAMIDEDFHQLYLKYRQEWDPDNHTFSKTFTEYFIEGMKHEFVTE